MVELRPAYRVGWGDESAQNRAKGGFWRDLAGCWPDLTLFSAPLPAFGDPTPPPGMVPYDHPVFHNGRRVLWHGAWRTEEGKTGDASKPDAAGPNKIAPSVAAKPAAAAPIKNAPSVAAAPATTPGANEYSILVDAEDSCATRLAGEFVAALQADGAQGPRDRGTNLAGGARPGGQERRRRSCDRADGRARSTPTRRARTGASARLISRASAPRRSRSSRRGRSSTSASSPAAPVGFGVADGAGAATAATLFSRLGVAPNPSFAPLAPALADLAAGKLAAVVAVGAKSSKALADFGKDGRFHSIAVPWSPSLRSLYAPARLTAKDRPNLIGADEKIDTLGAPMALIALDAAPSSPRADQAAALTRSFFEQFDRLLGPDNDASWRDVNLAAAASWPRLRAAQAWIDLKAAAPNASLDAFRAAAAATLANGGPEAADSDRLYDSLMQLRSAGP